MKQKCVCKIGGQAVLEGVMMRGTKASATAVRACDGSITIESERITVSPAVQKVSKIPILRGIVNFANSLVMGMKTITRSTEVFGEDDSEPTQFEKWLAKTFKIDIMDVVIFIGVLLGLALSIGLFVVIPLLIAQGIFALCSLPIPSGKLLFFAGSSSQYTSGQIFGYNVLYNLILGVMRMSIFIAYIALISKMKDIKRLFMYHGAEHKTISCYEHGLELTPENAKQFSTAHDRCGTTFMFIVMVVSILFFTVLPIDLLISVDSAVLQVIIRLLLRILLIPIVAGVSYEFLKLFAKYDTAFARAMKKPGLLLQKLTTREPDEEMLEVAITAFNEVLMLEADPTRPTRIFDIFSTAENVVKKVDLLLCNKTESELIAMFVIGAKNRTELYDGRHFTKEQAERCEKYAKQRLKGAPLQYILGTACFYGYDFVCDSRALIPRFDTEFLAEKVIAFCKEKEKAEVLDLCTGSGIIAITVAKNTDAVVTASDISGEALELAKINARKLDVEITLKQGSFFVPHKGKTFDIICANPPYIPSGDIAGLDKEVREYEPRLALDGGADGLDCYRDICGQANKYLKENGYLVLEVGIGEAEKVAEMLEGYEVSFIADYNNPPVQRVVVAKKTVQEE